MHPSEIPYFLEMISLDESSVSAVKLAKKSGLPAEKPDLLFSHNSRDP